MLLLIPPEYNISSFMGYLKDKFVNKHFWSTGYYVSTVGLNEATIAKNIREQEKQDQVEDKLTTKEYKYPFKGQPVLSPLRLVQSESQRRLGAGSFMPF